MDCWAGIDLRHFSAHDSTSSKVVLEIQHVFSTVSLPTHLAEHQNGAGFSQPRLEHEELVVVGADTRIITPEHVVERLSGIHIDYLFDPTSAPIQSPDSPIIARYFFDSQRRAFRPARLTTHLRGKKEIKTFGRQYLATHFANTNVLSLPMFLLIDAFGIFKNMYRAIDSFYTIPQYSQRQYRNMRSNLIPLTLGQFGSDIADTILGLFHLCGLDSGMNLYINNQEQFVCAFVGAILGDMPSQQKLSGCLSYKAGKPRRIFLISNNERGHLDFNIVEFGRHEEQLLIDSTRIREEPNKRRQNKAAIAYGIHEKWPLMDNLGWYPLSFRV
jgi:hypothetical protein